MSGVWLRRPGTALKRFFPLPDDKEDFVLNAGEMFVVPLGVEHQPVYSEEVHILLIEKSGTPNCGDTDTAAPRQLFVKIRIQSV